MIGENDTRIRGSCLCRAVVYAVAGCPGPMWHCHCLICRKLSGAAFATYVEAQASGFSWLRGQEHLTHYALSASLVRSFCQQCGSVVPYATSDGTRMVLPAGGLDDDPGVRPCAHSRVATQAPWHTITDTLPLRSTLPQGSIDGKRVQICFVEDEDRLLVSTVIHRGTGP